MFSRKSLVIGLAAIGLAMATAASIHAGGADTHTMYLTFSRPVLLPGVALDAGRYIFEMPDAAGGHSVVRVLSEDRKTVYLMAFTNQIARPYGQHNPPVSFKEAAPGSPRSISVWWPEDATGREFIYATK